MCKIQICLLLLLLLVACNDPSSVENIPKGIPEVPNSSLSSSAGSVSVINGVTVVEITADDKMRYNLEAFTVPVGGQVKLKLVNIGKMPIASMGHNLVILKLDVNINKFATDAASARENDYIPLKYAAEIIAATKLLGPGQSDIIDFTAPVEPGEYTYLCSFPAHLYAGMRGVMTVK
ncbi:MAG: plastocyanin/azurin family copper-binding protein [Verrucomicrobiota bacterium]|nr:plastocyanin/azurin family copper-binding protein [Verrucomicrobiota bacterium]MEC8333446.1 plastocyanin/azurin family copper-binding protein [Verrucomicrobiota bacterium]